MIAQPNYTERLAAIAELGQRFPGTHIRANELSSSDISKRLGLFAGIYLQTKWQLDSGRHELVMWHTINRALTIAPHEAYRNYRTVPETHESTVTDTWKKYYSAADAATRLVKSQNSIKRIQGSCFQYLRLPRLLWNAHIAAIREALKQHSALFQNTNIHPHELAFWRGWIRFVMFCSHFAPPTTHGFLYKFLQITMPLHSPLGESAKKDRAQPLLRRMFLWWLKYLGQNEVRFFQKYITPKQ